MHFSPLLVALPYLALHASARAIKSRTPYAVKSAHPVGQEWQRLGRAPADHPIELRIGLKQADFQQLEQHLYEVSSPSNPRYGNHLAAGEITPMVAPTNDALAQVHEWLADHGIQDLSYTSAKDWIKVKLPVKDVERLLDTEYSTFVRDDGLTLVRTTAWSLPQHLHEHISTIQPTNTFFGHAQAPLEKRASHLIAGPAIEAVDAPAPEDDAPVSEVCNVDLVTPDCVRTLYRTKHYAVQNPKDNKMGHTNYLGEDNFRPDTALFLQNYRPDAVGAEKEYEKISIDGGPATDGPINETQAEDGTGIEANLDTQAMLGVAWPVPLTTWSTGGSPPFIPDLTTPENTNEPYLAWLEYILEQPDPLPYVISTSYGEPEQTIPEDYARAVCDGFAQLGARGVTLFFSSGDAGIGADGECFSNDGQNTPKFLPAFPASCPYVTTVGGTYKTNPEVAVYRARPGRPIYTAGGGFSDLFPRPKYQEDAVSSYIDTIVKPLGYEGLYNPAGRGYPDIAGQALNYSVFWNATLRPVSGTSMSSPLVAAVFALVNDALLAAGSPPLGFLNPWIYEKGPDALNDILSGKASGCNTTEGLPAAEGWDAVTGWGTPDFPSILKSLDVGGWTDVE